MAADTKPREVHLFATFMLRSLKIKRLESADNCAHCVKHNIRRAVTLLLASPLHNKCLLASRL
jgi:hypothetical protein